MQFRDRDVINMIIGAVCAVVMTMLGVAVFGLWHHAEGPELPTIGLISGLLGFLCAVLAEYIRRWKGLTLSLISFAFFLMWLNQGNPDGLTRLFVMASIAVCGLLSVIFTVPQLIVNLMPVAERLGKRVKDVLPAGWWSS